MTGARGPRGGGPAKLPGISPVPAGAPDLPGGYDDRTRAWWSGILVLPHAAQFGEGEWQMALRAAFVLDMCWSKPSGALLTEVRRIEAALGVTRGDRERLGIKEPSPVPPPAAGADRKQRPDPRRQAGA